MDTVTSITLHGLLPRVFDNPEGRQAVSGSQVWLQDVTFCKGRHYLVSAQSGAGKSSLCAYIYGQRTDYLGAITFDGQDIAGFSIDQWCRLRRLSLAYLPQEIGLFPELTVMDNILLKARLSPSPTPPARIMEMLDALGIADKALQLAGRLSVGQQQRAALVRALCQPFDFLLLDEPVSHLDQANNLRAAALATEVADEVGGAIIATSVGNHLALPQAQVVTLHL